MSELALKLIREAKKTKAKSLNLSALDLEELPAQISELVWLEKLSLDRNNLVDISPLSSLSNLLELYLYSNRLTDISPLSSLLKLSELHLDYNQLIDTSPLSGLVNLSELYLNSNQLTDISPLSGLVNLSELYLNSNQLTDIAPLFGLVNLSELYLNSNPLKIPPPEIVRRGTRAILKYLGSIEQSASKFYEAKLLILGEGGVGKTTLYRKLQDVNAKMPEEEETTKGIEIHQLPFKMQDGEDFTINLWDFGGQEIYHATHQFFLSKRSLYVLVTDTRKEDTDFNYWLQVIELLSEGSPLIIVQNEREGRKKQLDIPVQFNNTVKIISLDLKEDFSAIQELRDTIKHYAQKLPHIGDTFPVSCLNIRLRLECISKKQSYIFFEKYNEICQEEGVESLGEMFMLSKYLHDWGVFLHFQEHNGLQDILILRNQWATKGVYALLDDSSINQRGEFTKQEAENIWKQYYDAEDYDKLFNLMKSFELCYEVKFKGKYRIPQLLSPSKPHYTWTYKNNIIVKYKYESFIPKGLIARFVVKMDDYADVVWQKGAVLKYPDASAEIIQNNEKRTVCIRINGQHRIELRDRIIAEFRRLHKIFGERLGVKILIPCCCEKCQESEDPMFYSHEGLRRRKVRGKEKIECDISLEDICIENLLDFNHIKSLDAVVHKNIKKTPVITPKKLFISYSKKDVEYLKTFKAHLAPLNREEKIVSWDDQNLIPGEEWDERIRYELDAADIIILFISSDFIATDYVMNVEVPRAIEQHRAGEVILIPIILRPCSWESQEFSKLKVLPTKGESVTVYENEDTAWREVVEQIKLVL